MQHNTRSNKTENRLREKLTFEITNDGTYISELGLDFGYCVKCGRKLKEHTYKFCDTLCRGDYYAEKSKDNSGLGD